jgi:hypothetical protein
MVRIFSIIFLLVTLADAEVRTIWQTLHDYNTIVEPVHDGRQDRHKVNPFLSYTNIGTDFGFVGPAENQLGWQPGQIGATLGDGPYEWAGIWHSLSRLARMKDSALNFSACYPAPITPAFQPKITAIRLVIRGKGRVKIDLVDGKNNLLWSEVREIDHQEFSHEVYTLQTEALSSVKMLEWIVEPGSDLDIDRVDLCIQTPDVTFDQWVFLASYAKALQCWSPTTGLVRDRSHIDDGSFDSISATGLFCLSTAAASSEKIVTIDFAKQVMHRAYDSVTPLRGPYQLLPHFAKKSDNGKLIRHEGTEYSTIDTALFYLSLMLTAQICDDQEMLKQLIDDVKKIQFAPLITPEGYVSHGVMDDGKTIIPYQWKDWGGETALVIILQHLSDPTLKVAMSRDGKPHQGTGFIAEIQSLLFPDFDSDAIDAISIVNWKLVRTSLLNEQKNYLSKNFPENSFTKQGFYGFSAGEYKHGMGYYVGGSDLTNQRLLHPHYVLMSAAIDATPSNVIDLLQRMERNNIFTPWGMVENVSITSGETLPMIGSLNACFEALGAYHLHKKISGGPNVIYDASHQISVMRSALKIFYP